MHSLKAHERAKVSFLSFLICLLDGADDLRHAMGVLYPVIKFAVYGDRKLFRDPEPIWKLWKRGKALAFVRNRKMIPRTSILLPSHYTYYAIPARLSR